MHVEKQHFASFPDKEGQIHLICGKISLGYELCYKVAAFIQVG